MKQYIISTVALGFLILPFLFISCEMFEGESTNSSLTGTWKLVDIVYNEPPNSIAFESNKCIDNKPYGFLDGKYYELKGSSNQPDSLTEFNKNQEYWTIKTGNSLIIKRDGVESSQCSCENSEVVYRQTDGFPVFNIKCTWKLSDNTLKIRTDDNETGNFKINSVGVDSLILEIVNSRLIFNKNDE